MIETPIYDSETGEESTEIITSYDQAKKALLHEFQKMTLDELLNLYRYFANTKIAAFFDNIGSNRFNFCRLQTKNYP